ncbi:MAG: hypothetical protein A2Y56_10130 [Candidatus Aminicenantes bacterium RBG_13_63_10]|nr:MAG: hypothetical protein A2Y56_10130 [Candidatus Aminicenantes bacterium RBG_13_63_10]
MPLRYRDHRQADGLAGEHRLGDAGQLVLALLFFSVWIADSFFFRFSTFLNEVAPLALRIPAGVILLASGLYLSRTGLAIVFGEKREKPVVIRKNVFGLVRHPIYLAELLLYAGLILLSMSLLSVGVAILAAVFLHRISRYEEKLLVERFGEEYKTYMTDVPMWIPRIRFSIKKVKA